MVQMGFFDIAKRYAGLDAKNDPLARIDEVVLWAAFRPRLETVWRRRPEERKSPAGRKPWDAVVMFKAIVLCELYNLSDEQVEYQLRDRLSFMRFLGLGLEDKVPDAKTVWLYREQLARAGVIETLFEDFDGYLEQQGYLAMGGQIIDASIVPAPTQRNSRDDNARIKEGETPEGWETQPAKRSQKDTDARWWAQSAANLSPCRASEVLALANPSGTKWDRGNRIKGLSEAIPGVKRATGAVESLGTRR